MTREGVGDHVLRGAQVNNLEESVCWLEQRDQTAG